MPNGVPAYDVYSEVNITNWRDYGVSSGMNAPDIMRTAIIGSSIVQDVNALSGGKNGLYNNHGCGRFFSNDMLFISVCDLFNRVGWSNGSTWDESARATFTDQPLVRINTNGLLGLSSYLERIAGEGRFEMIEQNTGPDVPGNHIFDTILQVGGAKQSQPSLIGVYHGGTTVRSYLGLMLNIPPATGSGAMGRFIAGEDSRGGTGNGEAGLRVYNATCIDLRTDVNAKDLTLSVTSGNNPMATIIDNNNLLQEPNRSASSQIGTETVSLPSLLDGYSPRHKGPRYGFLFQTGNLGQHGLRGRRHIVGAVQPDHGPDKQLQRGGQRQPDQPSLLAGDARDRREAHDPGEQRELPCALRRDFGFLRGRNECYHHKQQRHGLGCRAKLEIETRPHVTLPILR